jgi:hypothetical protein
MRFIAHARQDIPALIAEIRRLRASVPPDDLVWITREELGEFGRLKEAAQAPRPAPGSPSPDLEKEIAAVESYIASSKLYYLEEGKKNREEKLEMAEWGINRIRYHTFSAPSHGAPAPRSHEEKEYSKILDYTIKHCLYHGRGPDSSAADDIIAEVERLKRAPATPAAVPATQPQAQGESEC